MTYLLTARIRSAPAGMQGGLELCFSWGKTPSNFHQLVFVIFLNFILGYICLLKYLD